MKKDLFYRCLSILAFFSFIAICTFLTSCVPPEDPNETLERISTEAQAIVDSKIEIAFNRKSMLDPVEIAREIESIEGVISTKVSPSGTSIFIEQKTEYNLNLWLITRDDNRMFIEDAKKSYSSDLYQKGETQNTGFIVPNGNGKALILAPFQLSFQEDLTYYADCFKSAGYNTVDIYKDKAATIDQFKGSFLDNYDIILISTHGGYDYNDGVWTHGIMTGEIVSPERDKLLRNEGLLTLVTNDITPIFGKPRYVISPSWIRATVDDKFHNSWIFLNACRSAADDINMTLYKAFFDLGAIGYNGWKYDVSTFLAREATRNMVKEFTMGFPFQEASLMVRKHFSLLSPYTIRLPSFLEPIDINSFMDFQNPNFTDQFYLVYNNNAPNIPSSPNPANGATGISTSTALAWTCTDSDGDPVTYDVYFGTTSNPTTKIGTDLTTASISRSGLNQGVTYYWKVIAKDNQGNSTSGPIWSFSTLSGSGTIPTNGLVAYYPFNGNTNDMSGNNNHGTPYNVTLTADRHGVSNRAYLFDGVNDYIRINHSQSLNLSQQISISFWARLETSGPYYYPYHIIEKVGCWGSGQRENDLNWGIETINGSANIWSTNLSYNRFYHFVHVYDGSRILTYCDGTLRANTAANGNLKQNTNPVYIGRYQNGEDYYFDGTLDDFRIYNRALTQQEIIALYNE